MKNPLKVRRIRVDIVTVFLLLITSACLFTIFFSYSRNYKGIVELSDSMIHETNEDLVEKIDNITNQAKLLSELTKEVVSSSGIATESQKNLIGYLLNALKSDQMVYSINIAALDGSFISVINLTLASISHYYTKPTESLPLGSKYAVRIIDKGVTPPTEKWDYLGTDMQVLSSEIVNPITYDVKSDSWFVSMQKWPSIRWSNSYLPRGAEKQIATGEPGITVSAPVSDNNGKFSGIVGINLSLKFLSNFITHQRIGISGKAFILDISGNVVVPTPNNIDAESQTLAQKIIAPAYQQFLSTHQTHFLMENEETKYIVYISNFPISLDQKWAIAIAVPFLDFFGQTIRDQYQTIVISLAILVLFAIFVFYSSKHISKPIVQLAQEVDKIRHFDFENPVNIKTHIQEIITLDSSITAMRTALRSFGRYVPQEIVKTLIEQGQELKIGGEKRRITIMFTDIRDFTSSTESTPIDLLMASLGEYFDQLSKIILKSDGTIDKFIGDSIMALWGAPQKIDQQENKACLAALYCLKACRQLKNEAGEEKWPTRFGLHAGEVIVGNIGTAERMNYTAIGDSVNTASRLEGINKAYHTSIIISQSVKDGLDDSFITRPIDIVAVKGKKQKLTIYELVGTQKHADLAPTPAEIDLCKAFSEAFAAYHAGKIEEAKKRFSQIKQKYPSDYPTQIYLERIDSPATT